jgi:two-component system OmpR family sensor kinase
VIEDNGPGVMPSIQSSLFEPFSQALPPGSSSAAGRGLGLALARAVADSRGWQLTLEHSPHGRGATLSVKLSAEIGAPK